MFALSGLSFGLFLFGITATGQRVLHGPIRGSLSLSQVDNSFLSVELVPWLFGLCPALLTAMLGLGLLLRLRGRNAAESAQEPRRARHSEQEAGHVFFESQAGLRKTGSVD